ncbi:MAG: YtxH domain-containing protein [bacterium]
MSDSKTSSKFGLGLILGTVVGGLAAFFLSPTSGPQNQEMVAKKIKELEKLLADGNLEEKVKEIFGEATEEATAVYKKAKKNFIKSLAQAKGTIESLDKEQVAEVAHETVEILKKEAKHEEKEMEKLKAELAKEWKKLAPKQKAKS